MNEDSEKVLLRALGETLSEEILSVTTECHPLRDECIKHISCLIARVWSVLRRVYAEDTPRLAIAGLGIRPKHAMYYSKSSKTIVIRPERLMNAIDIYWKMLHLRPEETLFFYILHELGHYELDMLGASPMEVESIGYLRLHSKFEDYAISKILRGHTYRAIEKKILRFEAARVLSSLDEALISRLRRWQLGYLRRGLMARMIENLGLLGLVIALEYMRLSDLGCGAPILRLIRAITRHMRLITRGNIRSLGKISYRAWIAYSRLLG